MSESQLFDERDVVAETAAGFRDPESQDPSKIDSEIDFDDAEYEDVALMGEAEAGNAEGQADGHLDDPEQLSLDESQ
ncbi:MAG: hypothetical protein ACYCSF_02985 [Acidimicrobiales bacterium]